MYTETLNGLGRGIRASVSMSPLLIVYFGIYDIESYVYAIPRKAIVFVICNRTGNEHS